MFRTSPNTRDFVGKSQIPTAKRLRNIGYTPLCSRPLVARTLMARLPRLFRTPESLGKNQIAADNFGRLSFLY